VYYDWLQFGFDPQHSGVNPVETAISATTVTGLKVKHQVSFPAPVDGPPVYLSSVTTANGVQDLLFVETSQSDVYALDAQTLVTVWTKSHAPPPATPCTSSNGGACYTTSQPAIDPNRMFVYAYGLDGLIHKHQVGDGTEIMTGGWPERGTLKPNVEKGSSDLAWAVASDGTAYLYAASAGYPGDAGDYQGHLTTIKLSDGTQHVFNILCSDQPAHFTPGATPDCASTQAAVWARGGVLYRPDNGRIYVATGNGTFNAGMHDWGDSVLALNGDGTGVNGGPLDSWTPTDQAQLDSGDADIGSTGPALLPVPSTAKYPHLALQGAKTPTGGAGGPVRLLNLDDLSGMGGPGNLGGELFKLATVPQGNEILTQPAIWKNPADGTIYAFIANDSGISALKLVVDATTGAPSLATAWPGNGTKPEGGSSPIVVNGVLFQVGNGAGRQGNNTVYARDPTSGAVLWSAQLAPATGTTAIGGIHWESPIVAHGYLYVTSEHGNTAATVADGTGYLTSYGL
jgi:hypothetical protein